ncbi:MAG TPA: SDR family oxidoreductase [Flavitalea sp.]|nr:SDR family oxidoreductase [Flavitalea sp.]
MNIVITGASKGIGKAIAEKFAANGYSLFLCARNEQDLAETSRKIADSFPNIKVGYKACDVSKKNELKAFAAWIHTQAAAVDVLVNNAGSFVPGHVHEEEDGVIELLMETNLYSAYYLTKYLLQPMMDQKSGHIFNICSIASLKAYKHGGSYSITKYAMSGLSANLRDEMKHYGVKVTSVYPGAAYTASWDSSGVDPERIMKPDDIADMIFAAANLSPQACVEEIVIRPQLGDL